MVQDLLCGVARTVMPIFFHSEAHLWIAYALFFNGLLINRILLEYSQQYRELAQTFEAQAVLGFGFSIGFNGLTLLALDWLNKPFSFAIYVLILLSAVCLLLVLLKRLYRTWPIKILWPAIALYASMFVILFYNGAMIDHASDAWWHMSLANKIGWENSFSLQYGGHLTGASDRYYPPLWHGNLALLRELSGQQLPIIWNAFTAWGGALKLMAYFLVGLALFKDRSIALAGAIMFALLPGFGNSYMRVSAWPSHVAYVFWFFSIFVAFWLIDRIPQRASIKQASLHLASSYPILVSLSFALVLILFSHQFEILLFFGAVFLYLAGLSVARVFQRSTQTVLVDNQQALLTWTYRLGLTLLSVSALVMAYKLNERARGVDDVISLMLPVTAFAILLSADVLQTRLAIFSKIALITLLVILLVSIDYQHLASLVYHEMALPLSGSSERPVIATGWFDQPLSLPGWHLQLRRGLLWSGVLGAMLSLIFVLIYNHRAWVFIASNCVFIWALCTSPYLYEWFSDVLRYHSTWRFGMLSFHQLAIGAALVFVVRAFWSQLGEAREQSDA